MIIKSENKKNSLSLIKYSSLLFLSLFFCLSFSTCYIFDYIMAGISFKHHTWHNNGESIHRLVRDTQLSHTRVCTTIKRHKHEYIQSNMHHLNSTNAYRHCRRREVKVVVYITKNEYSDMPSPARACLSRIRQGRCKANSNRIQPTV